MKNLLTIFTLLLTVMIPSTSFAEWTRVGEGSDGTNYYVDFESIRKHDGYVYWWYLTDYLKPDPFGSFSVKIYKQGDCQLFMVKTLSYSYHKEPMGGGTSDVSSLEQEWMYPTLGSPLEDILNKVCGQ